MDTISTAAPRLIRRQELERRTGYRRSTIYAALKRGTKRFDPTFPRPVKLGGMVAWVESEVDEWINSRIADRAGCT
ncbi:helix-turn-helix transcriptional regulator [Stenotrophomonas maltophilia]|uniref:helix-turn-helix transcriptional regulator n=1 Tax=Stenotrophomonas maltophilia TaxID=40324 RepID=UPI001605292F|nr:AlpA family phage regulatory protein [Stenotrophomonas maltophilia]USA16234.1 AlpA family phage regulatory protein [Stenotrophomonas maltophilia]